MTAHRMQKAWSAGEERLLREAYAVKGPVALGRMLGRSHGAVSKKHKQLLLADNPELAKKKGPALPKGGPFDGLLCSALEAAVGFVGARMQTHAYLLVELTDGKLTILVTTEERFADKSPAALVGAWSRVKPGEVVDALATHLAEAEEVGA